MIYGTNRSLTKNSASLIHATGLMSTQAVSFAPWREMGGTTISTTGGSTSARAAFRLDNDDKIGFLVSWNCTAATTGNRRITVSAGSEGRAWNRDQGSYSFFPSGSATGTSGARYGKRWLLGPFESARFAVQSTSTDWNGRNEIRMTIVSACSSAGDLHCNKAHVLAFKMPVVNYST